MAKPLALEGKHLVTQDCEELLDYWSSGDWTPIERFAFPISRWPRRFCRTVRG